MTTRSRLLVGVCATVAALSAATTATAERSSPVPMATPMPVSLPGLDHPPYASCEQNYPDGLAAFPLAFDGTILEQRVARAAEMAPDPDRLMTPMIVTFQVNKDYTGRAGGRVVLRTWDYDSSTPNPSHVGERFLVATHESRDVTLCGFTRPYSDQDAIYWDSIFSAAE